MEEYKNLEDIFKLYEKHGSKGYIGESVSQYEHANAKQHFRQKNILNQVLVISMLK